MYGCHYRFVMRSFLQRAAKRRQATTAEMSVAHEVLGLRESRGVELLPQTYVGRIKLGIIHPLIPQDASVYSNLVCRIGKLSPLAGTNHIVTQDNKFFQILEVFFHDDGFHLLSFPLETYPIYEEVRLYAQPTLDQPILDAFDATFRDYLSLNFRYCSLDRDPSSVVVIPLTRVKSIVMHGTWRDHAEVLVTHDFRYIRE